MRPVNLRTDLAPLADLIELAFADSMDSGGRAALREMRYLSRMGPGLSLIARMNELAVGVSMGFVWIADGQLVGNVSVYPANWPGGLGSAWIIANVGVHPNYQKRGIARQLMQASLDMIRERKGTTAILQVDAENDRARRLYRGLGFTEERSFTTWLRRSSLRVPDRGSNTDVYIRHRRRAEWQQEMALAERIRPQQYGGIGWQRPLHPGTFRRPWLKAVNDALNLRGMERLVVEPQPGEEALRAVMWVENVFASKTRLTLMVDPLVQGIYDDALLQNVVRRSGRNPLSIEHPSDEIGVGNLLAYYGFTRQRTVVHMRWDAR
ncbi:MAG: hypothetical protein OHK0046_14730 [Anaerolineae bacterium]